MIELKYENVNPCKLQDELISAGLMVGSFLTFDLGNNTALLQLNDNTSIDDIDLITKVVAKHDKSPIPTPKTELEVLQEQLFNTRTELLQFQEYNNNLGMKLFELQTNILMNGVIK